MLFLDGLGELAHGDGARAELAHGDAARDVAEARGERRLCTGGQRQDDGRDTGVTGAGDVEDLALVGDGDLVDGAVLDEDHAELAARHEDALGMELLAKLLGCSDDVLGRRELAAHGRG